MPARAASNVFVLSYKQGYLVYAPLAGRVVFANADCVAQLRRFLETGDQQAVSPQVVSRVGGLRWLEPQREPTPLPTDRLFHPCAVTLFLTNRCNLRCTYCYAQAGEFQPKEMQAATYEAAIDLVMRNARRAGRPPQVGFHGGGEPTLAWDTLTGAVEYARKTAEAHGHPEIRFGIATNGVMPASRRDYVAETFPSVTLSLDGPPDVQNKMRPRADGSGSFEDVMSFVEEMRRRGTAFVIRSTITQENAERMAEMVDFFVDHTGCRQLHFEPAFASGRCCNLASGVPEPGVFAAAFIRAMDQARKRGAQVRFSAARLMGTFLSFCGCAQDPFNVTPEGDVTGCFEVCNAENPLAGTYHFGRFDRLTRRFLVDKERLAHLRSLTVPNKPVCAKCFARWSCSGDCPVKAEQPFFAADAESPRCQMIQAVTRAMLERAVESAPCPA